MLGWSIIFIVLLVVIIVLTVMFSVNNIDIILDLNAVFGLGYIFTIIFVVIIGFTLILLPLQVKQEVQTYNNVVEMVDMQRDNDSETNIALSNKVVEINEWLANAKSLESTYGIFSFYRNKLENLEYITLDWESE